MTRPCIKCGKPIKCYKSTYDKKKYCSIDCKEKDTHINVKCLVCNKKYKVAKSRYNNGKNIEFKTCSEKCRKEYHKNKKIDNNHICVNCGKSFNSRRKNKTEMIFCSQECSKKYMKGTNSPFWNGGTITTQGYKAIKIKGKYILEHRLVMEKYIGRKLLFEEDVHHIDGNKLNNNFNNLIMLSKSGHARLHGNFK